MGSEGLGAVSGAGSPLVGVPSGFHHFLDIIGGGRLAGLDTGLQPQGYDTRHTWGRHRSSLHGGVWIAGTVHHKVGLVVVSVVAVIINRSGVVVVHAGDNACAGRVDGGQSLARGAVTGGLVARERGVVANVGIGRAVVVGGALVVGDAVAGDVSTHRNHLVDTALVAHRALVITLAIVIARTAQVQVGAEPAGVAFPHVDRGRCAR